MAKLDLRKNKHGSKLDLKKSMLIKKHVPANEGIKGCTDNCTWTKAGKFDVEKEVKMAEAELKFKDMVGAPVAYDPLSWVPVSSHRLSLAKASINGRKLPGKTQRSIGGKLIRWQVISMKKSI